MPIVNELFKIIESSKSSQKEIAAKANLTSESFSRAKKRGSMNVSTLEKLAEVIGYHVTLIKREDHAMADNFPILGHASVMWSSDLKKNEISALPARLTNASFKDLIDLVILHGFEAVKETLELVKPEISEKRYAIQQDMLKNILKSLQKDEKSYVDSLFIKNCIALMNRIKSRNLYDLLSMIQKENKSIGEVFSTIQNLQPHTTYESIRFRLLDWPILIADEGSDEKIPMDIGEVRDFLRQEVDYMEVVMASIMFMNTKLPKIK